MKIYHNIPYSACSGAIGSSIATPTDLVKVRIQAEGALPDGQAPRYRSTVSAFKTIMTNEGIRGLYIGLVPTVQRATILTASQVSIYVLIIKRCIMRKSIQFHHKMAVALHDAMLSSKLPLKFKLKIVYSAAK